jgi:hypothetical protein
MDEVSTRQGYAIVVRATAEKPQVLQVDTANQLLLQELRVAEGYLSDEIEKSQSNHRNNKCLASAWGDICVTFEQIV